MAHGFLHIQISSLQMSRDLWYILSPFPLITQDIYTFRPLPLQMPREFWQIQKFQFKYYSRLAPDCFGR